MKSAESQKKYTFRFMFIFNPGRYKIRKVPWKLK